MKHITFSVILMAMIVFSTSAYASGKRDIVDVMMLVFEESSEADEAIQYLDTHWQPSFTPMMLETMYLTRNQSLRKSLLAVLSKNTQQTFGFNSDAWYQWLWSKPEQRHPDYATFKSRLYRNIDPRFANYFDAQRHTDIRLDEVRWGGVFQDGIPPLRNPKMIAAAKADYLEDDHIVFAIAVNGDARAYPKRILAWHEMFVDTIGGIPLAGVYCTLCGTVVAYDTRDHHGTQHALGTSGFLYRSNKLMYDKATQSMWNTVWGEPVIGPLTGKDISLEVHSVVTTTWGEWKRRHPKTTVLSLNTGHRRDYSEGAAYHDYFATDRLMFTVPKTDDRLRNKDEVFVPRFGDDNSPPLVISSDYLKKNPVYHTDYRGVNMLVLTDKSGAHRAYDAGKHRFTAYDGKHNATDSAGHSWTLSEDTLQDGKGASLSRLPSHNAFWFGWYAAHPDTKLIH